MAREGKTRGLGARLLGIRLVDARTGRQISRKQALVRAASGRVWQVATARLARRSRDPLGDREREDFRAKMEAVWRQFPDDSDACQEAFRRIHDEMPKPDMRGCWLALVARLLLTVAIEAPALWSPLKQGIPDKLAGTVHVVEPKGGRSGGSLGGLFGSLTDG
jgi:hypothetical protein